MKKMSVPMAIIMICTLFLTGQSASAAATPKSGGVIKVAYVANVRSLGFPASQVGRDTRFSSFAIESLFAIDSQGKIMPKLATSYEMDAAAKTIILHLRKGVKFHDGSDFNAEIVKWNIELFNSGRSKDLKAIASIDIIDNYTLRLNLSIFDNSLITLMSDYPGGKMISKKSFKGREWNEKNPVGTGPYQFVSWKKDVGITYKRFDGYWGGKVYPDGVELIHYSDGNVANMDLKAGNVHCREISARDYKELKNSDQVYLLHGVEGQPPAIAGSVRDPKSPFRDIRVRRAMAYAIDRETLAKTLGLGTYRVHNQWANPGMWSYNTDVKGYPYNPEKSKQLLAEAGYPKGFNTTFKFLYYAPHTKVQAVAIQHYLKAVGINAELEPMKPPSFNEVGMLGKGYDGILMIMGKCRVDPVVTYARIARGVEFNGMLKPQEFLDTYREAMQAPDQETKKDLVWKMHYLANDKYAMAAHLWVTSGYVAIAKNLKGVSVNAEGALVLDKAWFDK